MLARRKGDAYLIGHTATRRWSIDAWFHVTDAHTHAKRPAATLKALGFNALEAGRTLPGLVADGVVFLTRLAQLGVAWRAARRCDVFVTVPAMKDSNAYARAEPKTNRVACAKAGVAVANIRSAVPHLARR